jgi:multiple sugar transport system substrate-binding protein
MPYPANQFWNPDTWEPQMNSAEGIEALTYYLYLMDTYMPPGPTDVEWTAMITATQQGTTGHMINWTASFAPLEDPTASKVVGKMGWGTPPAGTKGQTASHRGCWIITIPTDSHNADAAWDFAVYQSDLKGMKKFALMGGFSGRLSLFNDPEINAKYPYYALQKDDYDAIAKAHAGRPHLPEYAQLMEVVNRNLSRAETKELKPKEALDNMAQECSTLLKQWGYLKG